MLNLNTISVDLYRKPSDRCAYLLPSSCHPPHTTKNIPFSLALRIVRICTYTDSRDLRLRELKEMLRSRDYGRGLNGTKTLKSWLAMIQKRRTQLLRILNTFQTMNKQSTLLNHSVK